MKTDIKTCIKSIEESLAKCSFEDDLNYKKQLEELLEDMKKTYKTKGNVEVDFNRGGNKLDD